MTFEVRDLGHMPYKSCEELQRQTLERVVNGEAANTLFLVEHPPVITLGANFHASNLLASVQALEARGIEVYRNERGGDVTFHGPGQLVAYPIFRLDEHDLHKWLRQLEETVLIVLSQLGLEGRRFPPHTGVWIGDEKVCAMGVKVRRWVSMHGLALNCNVDLGYFSHIVPCGIADYGVTSLTLAGGHPITVEQTKPALVKAFQQLFG